MYNLTPRRVFPVCFALVTAIASQVLATDWPMWRYDAGRTAASPENLPDKLDLLWERQYAPRKQVWDDPLNNDLMKFDKQFEPIVHADTVLVGFNDSDKMVALDLQTGDERWRFYAEAPIRLAPAAFNGKIYFTSDDGNLYCLNAHDGALLWQVDGDPETKLVLGNKRLVAMRPARGGVVIADGTVYFSAGIWPFMGTFFYAVDAATGQVAWLNDSNGPQWLVQPHGVSSFAGVAPQGSFLVAGGKLLVPGGRSVAACFNSRLFLTSLPKTGASWRCSFTSFSIFNRLISALPMAR